jgi:hypothetical protein
LAWDSLRIWIPFRFNGTRFSGDRFRKGDPSRQQMGPAAIFLEFFREAVRGTTSSLGSICSGRRTVPVRSVIFEVVAALERVELEEQRQASTSVAVLAGR